MKWMMVWTGLAALSLQPAAFAQGASTPGRNAPQQPSGTPQPKRQATIAIPLRVTQARPGGVIAVDRGERDGVQIGDRVVFHPLGGRALQARVVSVQQRNAEAQLADPNAELPIGSRGIVHLPRSRFPEPESTPEEDPVDSQPVEHPPWENMDEEFEAGMPLLVSIDGVRPEERLPLFSGRLYAIGNTRITSDDKRGDHFYRVGAALNYENLFGAGGQLNFEGETNQRDTFVNGQVDESTSEGRIERLSYSWGGTRFQPVRHEAGRFLQHGIPEFGVLDGYEWNKRLPSGHRVGTSVGYLPDISPTMDTGKDFAISSYYKWTADKRERVTATGAYQKTWHNSAPDRDLLIGKFDFWNEEGWDLHSTTWIDYYSDSDDINGSGLDLTRVIASTGRRWRDGDGLTFTYAHRSFPEIERTEFLPLLQQQLADDHNDRLASDGWTWLSRDRKLHSRFGIWSDQEDSGLDGDVGIEHFGVFAPTGRLDASVFGVDGKYSTTFGFRLDYGIQLARQSWDVTYEYSLNDQVGFADGNDDLEQHRLIGSFDHTSDSGWSFSLHGGAVTWAEETALIASFYIQQSF